MQNFETDRERAANDLAERLFFELEKQGNRLFVVPQDRRSCAEDGLTLDDVEHVLERWKLEGPHGG